MPPTASRRSGRLRSRAYRRRSRPRTRLSHRPRRLTAYLNQLLIKTINALYGTPPLPLLPYAALFRQILDTNIPHTVPTPRYHFCTNDRLRAALPSAFPNFTLFYAHTLSIEAVDVGGGVAALRRVVVESR